MVPNELPRPGDVVSGKYRIASVIGQGGMGVVLGAFDQSLGRPVAIKFLTPARALNAAAATRFDREARAAAAIQSEHVVRVYEVGALPNGAPFIVMEHLQGEDLAHVVEKRGGLPLDYTCDLVLQTCEALGDAHARGIVHRDLKPQNLFLTQRNDGSPCVKVLDFGISTAADSDESSPKLTSTDMVMGTPLYMSPEQVRSLKSVDARADIWALGAILHELLSASPPFDGPSASALHASIAMDPPASLLARRPDLPAGIEGAILRCLEKDPARRFQSVSELADALMPFASERGRHAARNIPRSGPRVPRSDPSLQLSALSAIGTASTMDVRSKPSGMPQPNARVVTAGAWQQASGSPVVETRPTNVIAIIVAVAMAFVALAGLAGAFLYFFTGRSVSVTETPVVVSGTPANAVPDVSAAPTATPGMMSAAPSPAPAPKIKDAGALTSKDAGPHVRTKDEQLAAGQRSAQSVCDLHEFSLSSATTDVDRKRAATNVKLSSCNQGPDAYRCQRTLCVKACTILNDPMCLRMQADADRAWPAKY